MTIYVTKLTRHESQTAESILAPIFPRVKRTLRGESLVVTQRRESSCFIIYLKMKNLGILEQLTFIIFKIIGIDFFFVSNGRFS